MSSDVLLIVVEFLGGPRDGEYSRSDSLDPLESREAMACYFMSGQGQTGWRFRLSRPDRDCGRSALYECVATGFLPTSADAGLLMLRCQYCYPVPVARSEA